MSCARYHELISRYADNEVTPRQKQELLHHVEHCHDCAAWLARVRQAEVLLKGVPDTRPSDRVRSAVLQTVREQRGAALTPKVQNPGLSFGGASLGFLLRFDPSPRRIALVVAACMVAFTALAYQLNLIAPWWGYDKLGFEVSGESNTAVDVSPIPAVSSGYNGAGGPVTVPNLVRILPAHDAKDVAPDEQLRVRFDLPMDRASVENVLRIDPPVAGAFSWDADNEVRFSPSSPGLLRGVTYRVVVSGTARSIAGTPLDEPITWSFRTRDLPSVVADLPLDLATISPDASLALAFSEPMDGVETARHISLRAGGSQEVIPVALSWDVEGHKLTVSPARALPEGKVSLYIGALARTRTGESLGRPFEFTYEVDLPMPRLRFAAGRLAVPELDSPLKVEYEAVAAYPPGPNADDVPLSNIDLKLYALTADRLSALGPETNGWPRPLPNGFLNGLATPTDVQVGLDPNAGAYGVAEISGAHAGIYLLTITAPAKGEMLLDWQVLVVADGRLALTEPGGPLWATGPDGHAWQDAEVSLYSPTGALIEKGLTGSTGLWYPSSKGAPASFAIVQDAAGHLAASRCDVTSGACGAKNIQPTSQLILHTDRSSYLPGQNINFQVLIGSIDGTSQGTPVVEQDVAVSLLMPGGATASLLRLKPDKTGGASGLFNLSPDLSPGRYTLRVSSGPDTRDFPFDVEAPSNDSLNLYIAPEAPATDPQMGQTSALTRTVTILGVGGAPAAGATITATLRIRGDSWTSPPVKAVANAQGRATVTLELPAWAERYTDPGLYLHVAAALQGQSGSAISYLDMTSPSRALAGVRQLTAPGIGVALIAPPVVEGNIRLRVVSLESQEITGPTGDLLVLAQAPSGEQASWSLDLNADAGGDVTLPIPARFAGGRVLVQRANKGETRELPLVLAQNPDVSLQITTAETVSPGAALPVTLALRAKESQPLAGSATVLFRPVSGASTQGIAYGWEPNAGISAEGKGSATLAAPTMPGLWYVLAQASALDGSHTWGWAVVRVSPGSSVQVPATQGAVSEEPQTVSVTVHNPTGQALSTSVRAVGGHGVAILGNASQPIELRPGGWGRLTWQLLPLQPGNSSVTFSFVPSAGIDGSWPLAIHSAVNPRTKTTYAAGSTQGERAVGVQVPSGLSDGAVELEIHASTSLLTTLGGIAASLPSSSSEGDGAVAAAARLSAVASVASAYRRVGASIPSSLAYSAVGRSLLLQQIYSAQHADGGWPLAGAGSVETSSVAATSYILLSLRRYNLVWADAAGDASAPDVDSTIVNRGLAYLAFQAGRPLPEESTQAALDERARALYVLSMYGILDAEQARPLMASAGGEPGEGLSTNGQAWLAMALLQAGASQDALALIDRITLEAGGDAKGQARASAPLLEALVAANHLDRQGRFGSLDPADYANAAEATSRALMDSREGIGWRTQMETGDALWSLSRFAAESAEKATTAAPAILLNDHAVQAASQPDGPGTLSIAVSGDALHAGTNWLKLTAPPGRTIYYSLTLRATR